MTFEEALKCMRERKEVKYRNDVYYIDKKGRLRVRYSDVEMMLIPSFTAEQIMSEDWEINMFKNQKKINISEGNVKEDNIKSGKTKHGDFIVKYLEEGSHYKVKEINVMENVAQRNSQDLEQVADTSKTIDHIVDVSKKVSLTEQLKKGELKEGEEYWVILTDEWYLRNPVEPVRAFYSCECEFEGYLNNDIKEVLAPVPSYEDWQSINGLIDSMQDTNKALDHRLNICKKLLKEAKEKFVNLDYAKGLIRRIEEVLK